MDIKAYISSGILEEYALGHIGEQERKEVECMSKIYPEIKEAIDQIELDLEQFAKSYAVKAPLAARSKILEAVKNQSQEPTLHAVNNEASLPPKEILISSDVTHEKSNWAGLAAAAAIVAFAIAVWQYSENRSARNDLQAFKQEQTSLQKKATELENKVAELSSGMDDIYNPFIKKVNLKSVKENDKTTLALLWNTQTGQVKLNSSQLPDLSKDKQYQLWVLKDGSPIDMGVLSKAEKGVLIASKSTRVGDAFAITIEPLGGKSSPTMDQLVVMGEIS